MLVRVESILSHLKSNAVAGLGSALLSAGITILWKQWTRSRRQQQLNLLRPQRCIVISGCDSGLGFSMAYWAGKSGYKVVAGCLSYESDGGQLLRKEFGLDNVFVVELDVTVAESIQNFHLQCCKFLERHAEQNLMLWAVIANAAIGSFGEFFWYSQEQQQRLMDVNFWGTLNLTKAFESLLLANKTRLIVVTSDCSEFPLPSLGVYSASKAALHSWAIALRREVAKYGVSVVTFQPGSFPMKSNLFSGQRKVYEEMKMELSETQLEFYGDYFHNFHQGLIGLFCDKPSHATVLEDSIIYSKFQYLLEEDVGFEPIVKAETMDIKIFHALLRHLPSKYADVLVTRLLKYPEWKPCAKLNGQAKDSIN